MMIAEKRKKLKKDGKSDAVEEDEPVSFFKCLSTFFFHFIDDYFNFFAGEI